MAARSRLGDWEGDTVVGPRKARPVIHVERRSGYLLVSRAADGTAEAVRRRAEAGLGKVPRALRLTLTYDKGPEFFEWELTEREPAWPSTSPTPTTRGSTGTARTRTACCADRSQRVRVSAV